MTTCPSCGIAGNNFNCPNHMTFWGINPLPDSISMPEQSAWSSLYAEIGRLNVLLNERVKEIERLRCEVDQLNRENHLLCNLRDNLFEERRELKECLRWYVENDDTNEGGMWEERNASWLEGKRRAMRALGMEEK